MAETVVPSVARRESVQPSLWDRLVDDLPGLVSETEVRRAELLADIGEERLQRILAGGRRAVEQEASLDRDERERAHTLIQMLERRAFLAERGIVVTADILREAVRRDLEMLFNTERLEARLLMTDAEEQTTESPVDLISDFPLVRRSVVNFGVPAFSGRRAKDFDPDALAKELREIVAVFEPRLKRESIRVKVEADEKAGLKIGIDAILMLSPVPERLRLSTSINLDNGNAMTRIEDA